ncbi:MAG: ABC transporter permease [Ruminococcus sp.]|nr:ABC transporter permease [Ruminococcus sp.]
MKFQNLLAKRYIFSQKRHSILTICSITAAITLMALMFTIFSTVMGSMRAYEYDARPYHVQFTPMTQEQCEAAETVEGVESCTLRENEFDGITWGEVLFEKGLEDDEAAIKSIYEKASLSDETIMTPNLTLMKYDFIGLIARYNFAQIFALFYIFIIFLAMAMRLVIDTAFEISSKERERQFGVLQSIGATPRQIVKIITYEGTVLSAIGIPLGLLLGVGLSYAAFRMVAGSGILSVFYENEEKASQLLQFSVNPLLLLAAAITGYVWVWLSAYGTGMRIIKMSPIQAISSRSNKIKKVKKHSLLGLLFGWKGTLAARNTRRAPKRFAITVVSLTVSITLFASFNYVLDTYETAIRGMYEEEGIEFDFSIDRIKNLDNPLEFKEDIKLLEESGYFEEIDFSDGGYGKYYYTESASEFTFIRYYNEKSYNQYFENKPQIPYDEFASKGGYILIERAKENALLEEQLKESDSLEISVSNHVKYTEEEYLAASEDEKTEYNIYTDLDENGEVIVTYYRREYTPHTFDITGRISSDEIRNDYIGIGDNVELISTIEQYERDYEIYGNNYLFNSYRYYCKLADGADYHKALDFIENNDNLMLEFDLYILNKKTESTIAFIKIIVGFINAMVIVIALVNLINIISTGLINRRSELAAMQCVGMTEKQLFGLSVTECLQYALTSGIASSVICAALIYGTFMLLKVMTLAGDFESAIEYLKPLPMVWLGALAAFLTALATAVVSLRGMKSKSLVEHIQSVE